MELREKGVRSSVVDPEFIVSRSIWTVSLIKAYGDVIKTPGAILVIDGVGSQLPLLLNFGEQKSASWAPDNVQNTIERMGGKMEPIRVTGADIERLKAEPHFSQKTWTISWIDAREFLWRVAHKDKLQIQFLW